jgi:hypothetical protein
LEQLDKHEYMSFQILFAKNRRPKDLVFGQAQFSYHMYRI